MQKIIIKVKNKIRFNLLYDKNSGLQKNKIRANKKGNFLVLKVIINFYD